MDQETGDWRDSLYQKTFDDEIRGLERRRVLDKNCGIDDMEAMLKNFYEMEGADWLGRGEVQGITLSATIAAYEFFVKKLKKEMGYL
ncbi:MAG: hypothetical protein LBB22_04995 [Treponema sp.]|jgi:hypothetical protein|nr:hypothetical protein [Treponema sp.]